jgi:uncharacterized protein HemX
MFPTIGLSLQAIKLIAAAVIVVLVAGLGFYGGYSAASHRAQAIITAQLKQAAEDNAKAITQILQHDAAANAAIAELTQLRAQRQATTKTIKKVIYATPKTQSCLSSPAIRAMLDGFGMHVTD